jgi:formylmethanofuran dehydrogenase subunit E
MWRFGNDDMSMSRYIRTKEHNKKIGLSNTGKKHSDVAKAKMSAAKKRLGLLPPSNSGKKFSDEHKKKMSDAHKGNKNSQWRGGSSFEPYSIDWTDTLRRSIRERDHYTCQICGAQQGEKTFDVHHIDYQKKNSDPLNLITLCRPCHRRTNSNRKEWIAYFGRIIWKR